MRTVSTCQQLGPHIPLPLVIVRVLERIQQIGRNDIPGIPYDATDPRHQIAAILDDRAVLIGIFPPHSLLAAGNRQFRYPTGTVQREGTPEALSIAVIGSYRELCLLPRISDRIAAVLIGNIDTRQPPGIVVTKYSFAFGNGPKEFANALHGFHVMNPLLPLRSAGAVHRLFLAGYGRQQHTASDRAQTIKSHRPVILT